MSEGREYEKDGLMFLCTDPNCEVNRDSSENMSEVRLVSGKEWRARAEQAEALLDAALELLAGASGSPVVFVARLAEFLSRPEVKERLK